MKPIRTLLLLALAGVALATPLQDIKLVRTASDGAMDKYVVSTKMKQDMDIPQMGQQDMTIDSTMSMTYKYGKTADGKQDVDIILSDFKVTAGGTIGEMIGDQIGGMMPKEFKVSGKMDSRGNLTDLKNDKLNSMQAMMMSSQQAANSMTMVVFPDKPVKIGDTWAMPIPDNKVTGIKGATLTAKLVGETKVDDTACYEISVEGTIPMKVNMADIGGDDGGASPIPADATMTGKLVAKGTAHVAKDNGRLVQYKGNVKHDTEMTLGSEGAAKINGSTQIDVKLKK